MERPQGSAVGSPRGPDGSVADKLLLSVTPLQEAKIWRNNATTSGVSFEDARHEDDFA